MASKFGLIGLAVMGENLVLNIASKGFSISVFNRTTSKVDSFVNGRAKKFGYGDKITGTYSLEEFVQSLEIPRKIMIMVRAGSAVDSVIQKLIPLVDKGDVIIDGGNSQFTDTQRRFEMLREKGILFIGTGVSGGEEGALKGPSMMPGGSIEAWPIVKPIFQEISAKVIEEDNSVSSCCEWMGEGGAGHYVKMVHNGIEYGDMQLICEAYMLMKNLGKSNEEMHNIFSQWNKEELGSYLIEITSEILLKKDEETGKFVVDLILDTAGQKGTGKWTSIESLQQGIPLTLISEAVYARALSAQKEERVIASSKIVGKTIEVNSISLDDIKQALYASKIISYAQGFSLLKSASKEFKWNLHFSDISKIWRGGCIIRSVFLNDITNAFRENSDLSNLMLDDFFNKRLMKAQESWRKVVSYCISKGIPVPALSSALSYFDGYRTACLPANLLQAQRDFFGAHTYERVDKKRGDFFHTNWTGEGGETTSNQYDV